MSNSVKSRDSALNAIKRYMAKSIDDAFTMDAETIVSFLQLLNEQWSRFSIAQDAVENSCGTDNADVEENVRIQAETWYSTALANFARVQKCRTEPPVQNASTPTIVSASIRLPKMELPTFSGDSTDWVGFYDAFCSLVDANSSLSDGQKMHYLRSCLKGDALKIISGFKICDATYKEAWDLLKSRFKVMRVIVESHFKAMADIRKASSDTARSIKDVLDAFQQHIRELKAIGRPVDFWDDWLVHEIVDRLAFETRKQWELSLVSDEPPTFEQLSTFLEVRCRSLSMLSGTAMPQATKSVTASRSTKVFHALPGQNCASCPFCKGSHKIYACNKFNPLESAAKLKFATEARLCLNCLSSGHFKARCNSVSACRICRQRHHTLLHSAVATTNVSAEGFPHSSSNYAATDIALMNAATALPANTYSLKTADACVPACLSSGADTLPVGETSILLATAFVKVRDYAGRWQPARLLFDSGSHATFVTEACVQRMGLSRTPSTAVITGIGSSQGGRARGEVTLSLSSYCSDKLYIINALILPKITSDLPTKTLTTSTWPHIQGLFLADPNFMKPSRVDILVGMDVMDQLICSEIRKGPPGTPMTQRTVFGWTLFGRVDGPPMPRLQALYSDVNLEKALTRLWELEEAPHKTHLTVEERLCEEHFESTHERAPDGRFIVELPLKPEVSLGDSRSLAIRSLLRIERKLASNNELRYRYNEFMQELIDMNHMEPVSEATSQMYYMPHHPVIKESSVTTKLRVVFNASAKTTTGNSLNDALFVGPQLQQDLISILIRFRTHRYAVTADVAKMYRQVRVSSKHADLQRIVWRVNPSMPIQDFRMLRVTYGVASASYLAVKSLQEIARYSSNKDEKAVETILRDFYMDDLLTGASRKDELQALQRNISEILSQGGFELRKWATNCEELNTIISNDSKKVSHYIADGKDVHALGLIWDTEEDCFTFAINLKPPLAVLSKRAFLSDASTLFDPLGLLAPTTIKSKMWFQDIWRAGIGWDDLIPETIAKHWSEHRSDLRSLATLRVDRWLNCGTRGSLTELHIFSDASERAYAAVIYARTVHSNGSVTVALISARTKVAPIKPATLPRLELCAAHLAAKLVKAVVHSWGNLRYPMYAWTDSTITLAWLQAHPSKWVTFIANRVADIQEVLPPECWNHVRSEQNPADCASRGISPTELLNHHLWWTGPSFLQGSDQFWKHRATEQHATVVGIRNKVPILFTASESQWSIITHYSSFSKLKRVIAYALRFVHNVRAKPPLTAEKRNGHLSSHEIVEAELHLIRAGKPLPLRSCILRLEPFLDENNILRVGGRLKHADVSPDVKHPIILSKNCPIARLIVSDIHQFTLHAGPRIMQVVLQRRYWVIGARNLIRNVYHKCAKCVCLNRNLAVQSMGDLPASRTRYARCFSRSAVDFAGPYFYKFTQGRGAKSTKGYICSFVCMCTGAMHLEFVGDLSASAFLNTFKRFINRRGYCKAMFSDNGTNFVGAERILHNDFQKCMADDRLRAFFADSNIDWRFNPPSAPHMGGYWETGIKRIKYHLKRVLGETILTYEEFSTLLTEVEACVNSRPLCESLTSAGDLEVLTPGHFIIGEPLEALPEPEGQGFCGDLRQRWRIISAIRQHFWRRWRDEYLTSLQRRSKWFRPSRNFKEDDVVAVFSDATPPTKWVLARVIKCHPGTDGRVRVVTLKTPNGELVRPIAKLCLLPTKGDLFDEEDT